MTAMINPVTTLVTWYEQLCPATLPAIRTHYAEACYFKDPFHEYQQLTQLETLFIQMFRKLEHPRFHVVECVGTMPNVFLVWNFECSLRGLALHIRGTSHLRFNDEGRVVYHRDYWDAAEELYERIPMLGILFRQLKKLAH